MSKHRPMQEFRKILSQYTDIPKENWAKFDVRDGGVSGEFCFGSPCITIAHISSAYSVPY